jgi:ribosomal protein L40E
MNEYIGKVCPFCKSEFKEGDDIVVCSACDMPHHKDCWVENQGCTTFGCTGTVKAVDGTATSVTATEIKYEEPKETPSVFCTKCGAKNPATAAFCSSCGAKLVSVSAPQRAQPSPQPATPPTAAPYAYATQQAYAPRPQQQVPQQNTAYTNTQYNNAYQQNAYSNPYYQQTVAIDPDVIALIGTKQEYYLPKFQAMKAQNKKTSWNWAAFFLTGYWFIYRKMYGYAAAVLVAAFIVALIAPVLIWGLYGVLGVYGNYLYMQSLEKKAMQAKTINELYRAQYLLKNGGTSIGTVFAVLAVMAVLAFIGAM